MKQYSELMQKVLDEGTQKHDRTGTGTLSIFGHQMRFNLQDGFPLVTTKRCHLRSIIHELLWFLQGDTNIKYLKENGVSIWDEWADEQGNLGPVYGKQWRSWQTVDGRVIDQIAGVVEQIKKNPDSPRLIVSAWNVAELDQMKLAPCHAFFQFYVADGKLSCQLYHVSRVTGRYNRTPQIVFMRKGRGMTNLTGEKVSVNQVITAIQEAAIETGTIPDHFRAEADQAASRYLLRVEFATQIDKETAKLFLAAFDRQLEQINIEYKAKRDSLRLGNPTLYLMREGWYERARKKQVEGGMRAFQAKTQLLAPSKEETVRILPELEAVVELEGS